MNLNDTSLKPIERLEKLFQEYWKAVKSTCGYEGGCFLGNCSQEIGNTNPVLSKEVDKSFRSTIDLYSACLKEAQKLGHLDSSMVADEVAEFILLSWQGVLVRAKTSKNEIPFNSFMNLIFQKVLK